MLEGFDKPSERVDFKATLHRKRRLHAVNEHFEHRTTKKPARVGGFAKPSNILRCGGVFGLIKKQY